jgi:hypothetical protein
MFLYEEEYAWNGRCHLITQVLIELALLRIARKPYVNIYGTVQQVAADVNAAFVFLRDLVIEEQGKIQHGADRRKPRLIDRPAIVNRLVGIAVFVTVPCGGNVCQWPFHKKAPPF